MDSSQLLERWLQFRKRCPDTADSIKKIVCSLYGERQNQETFDVELNRLQEHISLQAQQILGINVADKHSLSAWASAMGFIFLVKKEHELTGRHARR